MRSFHLVWTFARALIVRRAKEVWGKGLDNLQPTGKVDTAAPWFGREYDFAAAMDHLGISAARH